MSAKAKMKNSTPEQKAAWRMNQNIRSSYITVTSSTDYHPQRKSPSRRDAHRMRVAEAKRKRHSN